MAEKREEKMTILCIHGFRASGKILKTQISKWDPRIFADFDMAFPDGIFPAAGESGLEGIFPPPYFEWFQFNKEFTEYTNLDKCISYLCQYIKTKGPFHGLLGFSQGAALCALLIVHQTQGKLLKDHLPFKFFISISGSRFKNPKMIEELYNHTTMVKSVHIIGENDWMKPTSEDLAAAFHNPLIIRHPLGHTIPRLDETATDKLCCWIKEILQISVLPTNSQPGNWTSDSVAGDSTKFFQQPSSFMSNRL